MISRALGHRNLDVTRRYIDMDQEVLAEATENIFQSNEIYAMIAEKLL
jgi:outer membrane lipopolysaccharide assembly protein LptE/RlpB